MLFSQYDFAAHTIDPHIHFSLFTLVESVFWHSGSREQDKKQEKQMRITIFGPMKMGEHNTLIWYKELGVKFDCRPSEN